MDGAPQHAVGTPQHTVGTPGILGGIHFYRNKDAGLEKIANCNILIGQTKYLVAAAYSTRIICCTPKSLMR